MGFLGDFFLPKHLFRTADKISNGGLPEKDEAGNRQYKKSVLAIRTQALQSSEVIGGRLFPELAKKTIPFFGQITLAGALIFGIWLVFLLSVLCFAASRFMRGIRRAGEISRRQYEEKKQTEWLMQMQRNQANPLPIDRNADVQPAEPTNGGTHDH